MRNTLEDLYYGNITPGAQQIVPNSELKQAMDRVTRFESQLTERLDEDGQTILAKLIESRDEIESISARENFILGFRRGARITMECMDENDGDIREGQSRKLCKPPEWCRIEAPLWRFILWEEEIAVQKNRSAGRRFGSCCS